MMWKKLKENECRPQQLTPKKETPGDLLCMQPVSTDVDDAPAAAC